MRYPFNIDCGTHGFLVANEQALRDLAQQKTSLTSGFCRTADPATLLTVLLRQLEGSVTPA